MPLRLQVFSLRENSYCKLVDFVVNLLPSAIIAGMLPRLILLDADGVLWRGGQAIEHAPQFIRRARAAGIRCLLISNNAGPNRQAYLERCQRLSLDFDPEDIYSVNYLAGPYVARHYPEAKVLVLGSAMLVAEMRKSLPVTSADEWVAAHQLDGRPTDPHDLRTVLNPGFDVVFIGIDANVTYLKLCLACAAVQDGAHLLGANPDYSFPVENHVVLPGNGSIVELVAGVSGVEPAYLGKPALHLLEQIELETGVKRHEMLMVGDRIETDIKMANDAGVPAYLVLTGVVSPADVPKALDAKVIDTLDDLARELGI